MMDALSTTCPKCGADAEYPDCGNCGHLFVSESKQTGASTAMNWTEINGVGGQNLTTCNGTYEQLIDRLRTVGTFPSKRDCPWVKLATFGNKRSNGNSLRNNDNVVFVYGIEGDYDGEQILMEHAIEKLESYGIRAAVYPSPSWTAQAPRWRVVCPLSKAHIPSAHTALVARLNGALGGVLSPESFTLSQSYYFGATPTNDYQVLLTFDDPANGTCIDDLDELDQIAIGKRKASPTQQASAPAPHAFEGVTAVDPETVRDLRSALTMLRADDRALWVDLGHALKTLGDTGRSLWYEWSQTSDKYDPLDSAHKWETFNPERTGYQAVFAKAQLAGWVNPKSKAVSRQHSNLPKGVKEWTDPDTGEVSYWHEGTSGDQWIPPNDDGPKFHPLAKFVEMDGTVKPPRWVIPGFIGHGVTVIAGAHGVGKTTALLPLALTAAGLHGGELMPHQWRHVVYVTEDVEQAQRIIAGIVGHGELGIDLAAVRERLHLVEAVRLDPAFVATVGKTYREQFTRKVSGVMDDVEVLPLVVLDTKSAVLAVENENDNSEASAMMAALKQGFEGLPVWLIGHVAKPNLGRSDVAGLTSRGASAIEGDANQTMFLMQEGESRYLAQGKHRFESKWDELEIVSHTAETCALDEFGNEETVVMRWGIAAPAQQGRKEASEQAAEFAKQVEVMTLRQSVRDAVETAWQTGNPLNRAGVKAKVNRKSADVVATLENLLNERWLHEVAVPASLRTNNRKNAFLINLTTIEHDAVMAGANLPDEKLVIPKSWQKGAIPFVPEFSASAIESIAS